MKFISIFFSSLILLFLAGCGEPDCQKVSGSMLRVLGDKEVLRKPYEGHTISKSSAVDFYWGSKKKDDCSEICEKWKGSD